MLKTITVFLSLLYISFYLPFTLTAYNAGWYKVNCDFHARCENIGYEVAPAVGIGISLYLLASHHEPLGVVISMAMELLVT